MKQARALENNINLNGLMERVEHIVDEQIKELINRKSYSPDNHCLCKKKRVAQGDSYIDSRSSGASKGCSRTVPPHQPGRNTFSPAIQEEEDRIVVSNLAEQLKEDIGKAVDEFSCGLHRQLQKAAARIEENMRRRAADEKTRMEEERIQSQIDALKPSPTDTEHSEEEDKKENLSLAGLPGIDSPPDTSTHEVAAPKKEEEAISSSSDSISECGLEEKTSVVNIIKDDISDQQPITEVVAAAEPAPSEKPFDFAQGEPMDFSPNPNPENAPEADGTSGSFLDMTWGSTDGQQSPPPANEPPESAPGENSPGTVVDEPSAFSAEPATENTPEADGTSGSFLDMTWGSTDGRQSPPPVNDSPASAPGEDYPDPVQIEPLGFTADPVLENAPVGEADFESQFNTSRNYSEDRQSPAQAPDISGPDYDVSLFTQGVSPGLPPTTIPGSASGKNSLSVIDDTVVKMSEINQDRFERYQTRKETNPKS